MTITEIVVLAIYNGALFLLAVYGLHRLYLVRLRGTDPSHGSSRAAAQNPHWPSITVQLPVYNESNVVARLIDSAAAINYPGPLEIQLLDDSTDETSAIAAERIAAHAKAGVRIRHVRRSTRDGFKAGALAHGMSLSDSELLAVFDADFVPASDVLMKMVPAFEDPAVGMVQARWGHLNRTESLLTAVQAIYLDGHFAVESAARCRNELFFNFNGSAGIWRRAAISDAGGWSAETLTEDLDLSYRAQLAGWRFVFLPQVEVCAELPGSLSALQQQQRRWAKGSIQTARRILPSLLKTHLPRGMKIEAWFHLTGNLAYVLTTATAVLVVPVIVIRRNFSLDWLAIIDFILIAISTGSVLRFYLAGQRLNARADPPMRELLGTLPLGIAISLSNTVAVIEGCFLRAGTFARTPKSGGRSIRPTAAIWPVAETALAMFFTAAVATLISTGQWVALPLLSLFLAGYGYAAAGHFRWCQPRATKHA